MHNCHIVKYLALGDGTKDVRECPGTEQFRASFAIGSWSSFRQVDTQVSGAFPAHRGLDRTARRGASYWYRLAAVDFAGTVAPLGTVRALAMPEHALIREGPFPY